MTSTNNINIPQNDGNKMQKCVDFVVSELMKGINEGKGYGFYHSYSIPYEVARQAAEQFKKQGWYVYKHQHRDGSITGIQVFDTPQSEGYYPMETFTRM